MFGIGLIIIGIIVLLETFGLISGVPAGIVWGVTLICIGIAIIMRQSARRARRMEWIARHREKREDVPEK